MKIVFDESVPFEDCLDFQILKNHTYGANMQTNKELKYYYPPWTTVYCAFCGQEFYITRAYGKHYPLHSTFICEVCDAYDRGEKQTRDELEKESKEVLDKIFKEGYEQGYKAGLEAGSRNLIYFFAREKEQ